MTSSSDRSNEDFEREWREIAQGLSDIEEPTQPIAPPHRADGPARRLAGGAGPRDWNPASDEEIEQALAEDDDLSYREVPASRPGSGNPKPAIAWGACALLLLLGIAVGAGLLPGSAFVSGILLVAGIASGALAAFLSARTDDDPFDDGTRI